MEDYLRDPNVPSFLYPVSTATAYANINLSDPSKYNEANYKYHQYFANLNNNCTNSSTFYPNDSFPYYKSHKVFRPLSKSRVKEKCTSRFSSNTNTSINSSDPNYNAARNKNLKSFQKFNTFASVPSIFSDIGPDGNSYHTSVDMPDGIYMLGGLRSLTTEEYEKRLRYITKNFTIPPTNIKMICDYDLPIPVDKDKIASIATTPATRMVKYIHESKSLRFVCELYDEHNALDGDNGNNSDEQIPAGKTNKLNLKAFEDSINPNPMSSTTNTMSNTSSYLIGTPKPVICSSASKLSNRFFMVYGGLEVETKITFPDENHCVIEKILIPNDQFWLFDVIKSHFREIKLSVHPTYSAIFPSSTPRFGHRTESVPLDEHTLHDSTDNNKGNNSSSSLKQQLNESYTKPATMFVMGGYKLNSSGKSFISMNDLWKLDFFLDANGTSDEAIASPIGDFRVTNNDLSYVIDKNMKQLINRDDSPKFTGVFRHSNESSNWPSPRGFFSCTIIESAKLKGYINWRKNDYESNITINIEENEKEGVQKIKVPIPKRRTNLPLSPSSIVNNTHNKNSNNHHHNNMTNVSTISQVLEEHTDRLSNSSPTDSMKTKSSKDFKIKDLFTHQNKLVEPSLRTLSSDSSGDSTMKSPSPYSDAGLHTNTIEALKGKVLLIFGGSSILYTKVNYDDEYDIYYNHSICDDMWIFDFQTERWYNLNDYIKFEKRISICGHEMFFSGEAFKLFGGIEGKHYPPEFYKPVQAGLYGFAQGDDGKNQNVNCSKGLKIVTKFLESKIHYYDASNHIQNSDIKTVLGVDIGDEQTYNYYVNYEFRLKSLRWRMVKVAVIQDLDFIGPWEDHKDKKIVCGGMVDELTMDEKESLTNKSIIYTNCPSFMRNSKLIMFFPDTKLLDLSTNKIVPGNQRLLGNGICEINSVYV